MKNSAPNLIGTRQQRLRFDVRLLAILFCFSMAAWSAFGAKSSPQPAMASVSAKSLSVAASTKPKQHVPQQVRSIPIGEYDVAFQVVADNPTGEKDDEFGDTVDPPNWRKLILVARKKDGSFAEVRLLRPLWWLEKQDAKVGGTVEINVPECGIEGEAKVLAIEPCPPIKPRPGLRVVTGVFKHRASQVLDVYVEGIDEPIGTTPNHPFWSEDRRTFVRADELKEGEHLRAFNGTPIVRQIIPLADPEPVFNLEVQCDHVYHVAKNGVLVHNSGAWQCYENLVTNLYGGRAALGSRSFTGAATGLNRIADNVVEQGGRTIAVEAKRIGNWSKSIYNPGSSIAQRPWATAARTHNVNQLQDYAEVFDDVVIHSNSREFLNYMSNQANQLGLKNIFFVFTPH
jgi:hypothetical protein